MEFHIQHDVANTHFELRKRPFKFFTPNYSKVMVMVMVMVTRYGTPCLFSYGVRPSVALIL